MGLLLWLLQLLLQWLFGVVAASGVGVITLQVS